MTRSVRLRAWQRRALERLDAHSRADFLAVATPGAGKTTFALTALRTRLATAPHQRVVIVAPTAHLKVQWTEAASRFDIELDDQWSPGDGPPPTDMHGIVTTYQQVASSGAAIAPLAAQGLVIFDEVHHAADDRAWGTGLRTAFSDAAWRLSLSGTPFRSDTQAIPFVTYELDEAVPDFEYGYGDALRDRHVVRPVEFPRLNGEMEWISPDGTVRQASFDDPLEASLASQRLRTALSVEGDWMPAVLRDAHGRLSAIRRSEPDAAGLVIASDQDHARGIAALLRRHHGVDAVVATSDDPEASRRIARFRHGTDPWIVAVRMVSEGVDIPRVRVGVFATTTTTELFFRQAVGRLVRWTPGSADQHAYFYIPDDARLRARAFEINEQRRHSLRRDHNGDVREEPLGADARLDSGEEEQLSLFAALTAVPMGEVAVTQSASLPSEESIHGDSLEGDDLVLEFAPLPRPGFAFSGAGGDESTTLVRQPAPRERRRLLRSQNAARVADLVHFANMTHAGVNAELNRLSGITKITDATEDQLRRRLDAANRWLRRG